MTAATILVAAFFMPIVSSDRFQENCRRDAALRGNIAGRIPEAGCSNGGILLMHVTHDQEVPNCGQCPPSR